MTRREVRSAASVALGFVGCLLSLGCGSDSKSDANAGVAPPDQGDFSRPGDPVSNPGGQVSGSGGYANYGTSMGGASSGSPVLGSGGALSVTGPGSPDAGAVVASPGPQIVNPFTLTTHDPLSTFGADVDTASYDQFVRDISAGALPSPSVVRTEDFVNYFKYDYPAPAVDAKDPFSISLAAAPSVFADGTTVLRVGIQGKLPPPSEKKPANIVFLVDVSGSMQTAEKLPLVKFTVEHALDVLAPTDTVSLVKYADGVGVVLGPTPASDRTTITTAVEGLQAGGGTNGAGGIQLAYQEATAGFIQGGINDVVLCTDGDFNIGISTTSDLINFITTQKKTGVMLTALGFGSAVNDSMMEAVSNAGNGVYSVITSESQATDFVQNRLLSELTYIAQDVKIQVEFNPAEVYAYRLMGYEDRAIPDAQFRNDAVDAGEIGAGHRVTALYQVVLAGGSIPTVTGAAPIADGAPFAGTVQVSPGDAVLVKVRYKDVGAASTDPAKEVATPLSVSAIHGDIAGTDPDMRWAVSVAAFAEILRGSPYAKREALPTISTLLGGSAGTTADRTAFLGLYATAQTLLTQ